MSDPLTPTPAHHFTFGLWTVGNPGRDPFGHEVRAPLDPVDTVHHLSEVGAYGVSFHDDDLVPYGSSASERQVVVKRFAQALEETGLKVPMVTTNLFSRPIFKEGAFTANDPEVRRFAIRKACEAIDLGAEFGAEIFVMWGGREGVEADAAKDVRAALDRYKEAVDLCCEYIRDQGLAMRIAMEPKPNEPRGDIFLPTVGHVLAFIGALEWPDMVGVNPEFAHETMSGLSFSHAVAQVLWHKKLFHIDLNAQRIGKFDQDFRFGSEGIRDAFYLVKVLEDAQWDGMKHFDAHPYRTEDSSRRLGVRPGLHPHLPDTGGQGAPVRGGRRRSRRHYAWPRSPSWARGRRRGRTRRHSQGLLRRGRARRPGLRSRAPRSTGDGAAARGALVPLVVGVDSSTTSCKVQVRDADSGALVGSGWAPHPPTAPPRSEQDPHAWEEAFSAAAAMAGALDVQPAAIAIAAQQHGAVIVGDRGDVVRPAKLWNDTESAPDARELLAALPGGAAAWAEACGSVPLASFTITKLRWLRRCEPESFRRMRAVLLPHDWLTFRLTGGMTTDRGEASGTGYWSPAEGRYRPDLLKLVDEEVDWDQMLPSVLGPDTAAGTWAGTETIVGPGTGDNMAGALGLGLRPGDLCLSFGTSGVACTVADQPRADPSGTVAGFADATGRFLPLVCTLNATKVTDSVARLLGVTLEEFDALALSAPAGAGGLTLVPHFDGERTPNRPEATGTLVGIGNDLAPADLARAAVEGVVCNLLGGADSLARGDRTGSHRVFLVGGGARSAAYRQITADLVGAPVIVPSESELVASGAAVQAAALFHGCGFDALAEAWGLGAGVVVEPTGSVDRAAVRAAYSEAMARAAP